MCVVCKGEAEVRGDGWDRVRCMARRMDLRDAGGGAGCYERSQRSQSGLQGNDQTPFAY